MKDKKIKIEKVKLTSLALKCRDRFKETQSRHEALELIARETANELGDYLNADALESPDDIAIAFIELLDQVIFELGEEYNTNETKIEEYLLDELYQRLEIYLDLFNGIDVYKNGFSSRIMSRDDTLIIRYYKIREFIPHLISEFTEQPHLRVSIVRALIFFNEEEHLNFFYDIATGEYDIELKILALLGLKINRNKFGKWDRLSETNGDKKYEALLTYITDNELNPPRFQDNIYILFYKILYLEIMLEKDMGFLECNFILHVLDQISRYNIDILPFKYYLYESLSRVIYRIQSETMHKYLNMEDNLITFIRIVDNIQGEIFDKIIAMTNCLGDEFIASIERLVSSGKVHLEEKNSKLSSYLFSVGFDPLLL